MTDLLRALALACALGALGCAPPAAAGPPAGVAAPSPLVGHWHGSLAGGPISAVADYIFAADGTYRMDGYPSIAERGRYTVETPTGGALLIHLSGRTKCGPCENAGPVDAAPDSDETATLSDDGSTLTWRGWTFSRVAAAP